MRMLKRMVVVSLLIVSVATIGFSAAQSEPAAMSEEIVELKLYTVGDAPADIDKVWDAVNEQLKEKIGATISPTVIPFSDRQQKYPILLASGEPIDLVFIAAWNFLNAVPDGAFMPIDDLLNEYGPVLLERIPDLGWSVGSFDGKRYMVPKLQTEFETHGMIIREDLRVKYNAPEPWDYESALAYFKAIKDNEPEMLPYNATADGQLPVMWMNPMDLMHPGIAPIERAVRFSLKDLATVVNMTELPEYRDYLDFTRACYLNGYWSRSVLANEVSIRESFENNRSAALSWNPITAGQIANKVEASIPGAKVEYYSYEKDSYVAQLGYKAGFAIYNASKHPEKSMQWLNLMHSDEDLYRTLWYGIRGEHWDLTTDGKLTRPAGVTDGDVKYNATYMIHGVYDEKYHLTSVNEWPRVAEINAELKKNGKDYLLQTFVPSTDSIKAEIAAVANVISELMVPLNWGVVDPEKGLPELQAALKKAGIDKIVAELQKQMDAHNAK